MFRRFSVYPSADQLTVDTNVKLFQWAKTRVKVKRLTSAHASGSSNQFNVLSRLVDEATKNAKDHIPHALYNLDSALNKIQQHRPHFKSNRELQKCIDKGTNC
jgi:hypothetical protein